MSSQQRAGIVPILSAIAVVVLVHPFIIGLLGSLALAVVAAPVYHRMRVRIRDSPRRSWWPVP